MAGNVWEWTGSLYGRPMRVVRGGSYWGLDDGVRCAYRDGYFPSSCSVDLGFRVCAVIQQE